MTTDELIKQVLEHDAAATPRPWLTDNDDERFGRTREERNCGEHWIHQPLRWADNGELVTLAEVEATE